MKLGLWIFITVAVCEGLTYFLNAPSLNIFILIGLGLGFYLLKEHPLVKKGFPFAAEVGLATVLIGIFVLHFGFVILVPGLVAQDAADEPCSSQSLEAQCYSLSPTACRSAWDHYKEVCSQEARAAVDTKVTRLVGSGVKKCIQKKFKAYMSYNRKTEDSDVCREYFASLSE
jgi:hypothetical protein